MKLTEKGIAEIGTKFEEFKNSGFPRGNALNQEARILHGDLVLYDAHIAGLLTCLINGRDVEAASLHTEEGLRARLQDYGRRFSNAGPFVGDRLRRLDDLHRLVRMSKERTVEP